MGKKRQPIYKVVAADARSPRDGKFIEAIGFYNPKTDPAQIDIVEDRALYWLEVGAKPTETVKNLLSVKGILFKKELIKQGLDDSKIEVQMEEFYKEQEAKFQKKLKNKEKKTAEAKKNKEKENSKGAQEAEGTASEEVKAEEIKAES
jgi:small subunit ribosomal protein S16